MQKLEQKSIKASFSKPSSLLLVWFVLHNNEPSETTTNVGSTSFFRFRKHIFNDENSIHV